MRIPAFREFGFWTSLYRNSVHHGGDLTGQRRYLYITVLRSGSHGLAVFTRASARVWNHADIRRALLHRTALAVPADGN
jgi:hypothetical protein